MNKHFFNEVVDFLRKNLNEEGDTELGGVGLEKIFEQGKYLSLIHPKFLLFKPTKEF